MREYKKGDTVTLKKLEDVKLDLPIYLYRKCFSEIFGQPYIIIRVDNVDICPYVIKYKRRHWYINPDWIAEPAELPPLIQHLTDAIEKKGLKIRFGLDQQGHIPTIEKMLNNGEFISSYHRWVDIGKAIGWEPLSAALQYMEYLREKTEPPEDVKEFLSQLKANYMSELRFTRLEAILKKYGI